jgi:hypothetical protein
MNRKELLIVRNNLLKESEAIKEKLSRVDVMIASLKKEEATRTESEKTIIEACINFINGISKENNFNLYDKSVERYNIKKIFEDIENIRINLLRELGEKNDSLRSIEKLLWKQLFEELKTELHEKSKNLIERIAVVKINMGEGLDFNFLFGDIFGKWQRGPSVEKRGIIEKEVKESWK